MPTPADRLRQVKTFDDLVAYLQDELDWPLQDYPFDEVTFEYRPEELGLKEEDAAKVKAVHQLRPLNDGQPWGIFFVEFERKRMPVVVLRRILSHLVVKKRAASHQAREAAWDLGDLLFIAAFGEDGRTGASEREVAFAHFHREAEGDLPTLQVLGWDGADTGLKLDYVADELRTRLCWPEDPEDTAAWREQWAGAFRHGLYHNIRTSDALATALATLAQRIRAAALTLMAHETEKGGLRQLHKAFQTALIHDLTEKDFADTYAQTVTYGLLTAAISSTDMDAGAYGTAVHAGKLADMVPLTNPFLKEMLGTFLQAGGQKGGINFDELGVQEVVELLRSDATDLPAILRDFGNKTHGEDPVIFFYEHFLAAYDKQLKVQRGSFYTPKPVVSYIVRSVHELLQSEFGLADGLADTATWGEMAARTPGLIIPEGTPPDAPFVVILDPATGTGTFLVEVIDVIHRTLTEKWRKEGQGEAQRLALWNEYVPAHLLPRLHGYELMMAPYAIAHMKIGLKLWETGYRFGGSVERVRVYLTNALEPADEGAGQLQFAGWAPALAHEAQAVNAVKRWQRFTVVVGNPPYAGHSANKGLWISKLVRDFYSLAGEPMAELNTKWLQDDYVKFVRLALYEIQRSQTGVIGVITNHGYIDNPTFRGMRYLIQQTLPQTWIYDLHGNTKKKERQPDGTIDENVFDIQQGTAVLLGARCAEVLRREVSIADLYGNRESKYQTLKSTSASSTSLRRVNPSRPFYFFSHRNEDFKAEYDECLGIPDIFAMHSLGVVSARDNLCIKWSFEEIWDTVVEFSEMDPEEARVAFDLGPDARDWKVELAQDDLINSGPDDVLTTKILYRPFDLRWTYYTGKSRGFHCMPRGEVMSHLLRIKNLALATTRNIEVGKFRHVFCTRMIAGHHCVSLKEVNHIFPLYLAPGEDEWLSDPRPNLSAKAVKAFKGLSLNPEVIFSYVYAILHTPGYRERYAEALKDDFPRIPLTSNIDLFRALAALGERLVGLHLMESPVLDAEKDDLCVYAGPDEPVVGKVSWEDESVYLDRTGDARFCCISEAVWNFHIGGYQVCEKWLKDRKGRRLSAEEIDHYRKVVVALQHTLYIMDEIDAVIEEHGGWPIK